MREGPASRTRYYSTFEVDDEGCLVLGPRGWFETAYLSAGEWQGA